MTQLDIAVIGINHKTAPVEIREKLSFSPGKIVDANRLLKETLSFRESLILSTCNRVEIYAVPGNAADHVSDIKNFLARYHGADLAEYGERIYVKRGRSAVEHLFGVTAGLDSMVVGEVEISGQVKKAYNDAREGLTTGKALNRLFEKALNTAKKIRTKTLIGRGPVSVSSVAVALAEKILGKLEDKTALIIGTGEIGEKLLLYLKKNGIKSVLVANRTREKALDLASRFKAEAVAFREFIARLADVDIVIVATGAPHSLIRKDDIVPLMPRRKQRPLFIIDLAVPRHVEGAINKIDNAYLYDIDDLEKITSENMNSRKGELENCFEIVRSSADNYMKWIEAVNAEGENRFSLLSGGLRPGRAK
ncbi:MAG: glutamyl-tRNA reductase [Candidatus Omnitrophica bacterium]|nr:glutamyl-tRNA reductase [Candidatus Omnitrophota bacterium]